MSDPIEEHRKRTEEKHAKAAAHTAKLARADARRILRGFATLRPVEQRRAVEALTRGLLASEEWREGSWWAE